MRSINGRKWYGDKALYAVSSLDAFSQAHIISIKILLVVACVELVQTVFDSWRNEADSTYEKVLNDKEELLVNQLLHHPSPAIQNVYKNCQKEKTNLFEQLPDELSFHFNT